MLFNLTKKEKIKEKYTYQMCINQSAFQKLKRPTFLFVFFLFLKPACYLRERPPTVNVFITVNTFHFS